MANMKSWNIPSLTPYFIVFFFSLQVLISDADDPTREYDFIIVGAGASGAVVANRLSEVKSYDILLLEAGGEPPAFNQIPYFSPGPRGGEYEWTFKTEKATTGSLGFKNQMWPWWRGKGLGGSTLVNGLAFTRGNRRDYDIWQEMGNEGWGYDDVLPYFVKMEDYQESQMGKDEKYHGKGGPVTVSKPPYKTPYADIFLDAGKELDYKRVDYNGVNQTGYDNPVYALRNGSRCGSYKAYIEPAMARKNLQIITYAFVTKVLFDENRRAIGVVYDKNGSSIAVKFRKEVIISGGTVMSPLLLMLSGIGPKETLKQHGIPVIVHLPGVGENLLDHASVAGLTFTIEENIGFQPALDTSPENFELWERRRQGPLTVPVRGEGLIFVNSKYADPKMDYPDLELLLSQPAKPAPLALDKKVYDAAFGPKDGKQMFQVNPIVLHSNSSGTLTLRSANPYDPPVIHTNYLESDYDVKVLIEGVKLSIQLMNTTSFRNAGVKWHGRLYPGCEQFEELSEEYLECYVRRYSFGYYHQSGTCKMGTKSDPMAVVDSRLRVHGVERLRVIDGSITPTMVSGHTMAACFMIGEKGADMILHDWRQVQQK